MREERLIAVAHDVLISICSINMETWLVDVIVNSSEGAWTEVFNAACGESMPWKYSCKCN